MSSGWEKWHDWNAKVMRPMTSWFCQASGAAPGHTILDAACGTGLPSLALAHCVRPGGKVLAIDISGEMVATARRKAALAGIDNIEHREMDLAALDLPDAAFDAVTCSFALMFCPDPVKAASELHRVLRPQGRLAIAVWDEPVRNPFFTTLFQNIGRFVPRPPPNPQAPGPFRLAPPGELEAVLCEAGFTELSVEPREVCFEFDSVDMHWQISADMAPPLRAAAQSLPEVDLARLKEAIIGALEPYVNNGRVRIPNTALCASARR